MSSMARQLNMVSILPLEGDSKGKGIETGFNPTELSFSKASGWSADSQGTSTNAPSESFTAGKPISLDVEFFFDKYEAGEDVRDDVKKLVHLCEIQEIGGEKRPPIVQLVWADSKLYNEEKPFIAVVDTATVKYLMFTSKGVPCRASVSVKLTQIEKEGMGSTSAAAGTKVVNLSTLTPAEAVDKGYQEEIEKRGGKIEEPSTWPKTITTGSKA